LGGRTTPGFPYRTPKAGRDHPIGVVDPGGKRQRLDRRATPEAKENDDRLIAEWLSNGRDVPKAAPNPLSRSR